jgi:hypothetical protein
MVSPLGFLFSRSLSFYGAGDPAGDFARGLRRFVADSASGASRFFRCGPTRYGKRAPPGNWLLRILITPD